MSDTLVIWFENGNTSYFENVTEFEATDNILSFKYFGVRSQTNRGATFILNNIAGFAIQEG